MSPFSQQLPLNQIEIDKWSFYLFSRYKQDLEDSYSLLALYPGGIPRSEAPRQPTIYKVKQNLTFLTPPPPSPSVTLKCQFLHLSLYLVLYNHQPPSPYLRDVIYECSLKACAKVTKYLYAVACTMFPGYSFRSAIKVTSNTELV